MYLGSEYDYLRHSHEPGFAELVATEIFYQIAAIFSMVNNPIKKNSKTIFYFVQK
jgi:hypothetical protein